MKKKRKGKVNYQPVLITGCFITTLIVDSFSEGRVVDMGGGGGMNVGGPLTSLLIDTVVLSSRTTFIGGFAVTGDEGFEN